MSFALINVLIVVIPFIWIIYSYIDVYRGKREKINWKGPLLFLLGYIVIGLFITIYLSGKYDFALFISSGMTIAGLILTITVFCILALINLFITFTNRKNPLPKSIHNPKVVWVVAVGFSFFMLVISLWVLPLNQKMLYVQNIEKAMNTFEESNQEEISVAFAMSEKPCLRIVRCNTNYSNIFFVKNNLDEEKEVQVKIRALNRNNEEIKVIDSKVMNLEPGEESLVITEETLDEKNEWTSYTFETEQRIHGYQYLFRYQ